jgi:hypothetical protein
MKTIVINSKKYGKHEIFVDDEDFERVNQYKWHLIKPKNSKNNYAGSNIYLGNGKQKPITLHRFIMNVTDPKIHIDHIFHNGLDCQKKNLRTCNRSQNGANRTKNINSKSKYLGVYLSIDKRNDKTYSYWRAQLNINGKRTHIGSFKNELDAAKAYDKYAIKHYGDFANINFK